MWTPGSPKAWPNGWTTRPPLRSSRARAGDRIQPGRVYVAGGEKHLVMETSSVLGLAATPLDIPYRPSVDVFFESLAKSGRRPACAVLLTGMGKDGARGMLALRKLGWWTVAQDEATSVVWGMPKAAVELEAANKVLPLEKIAPAVADRIRRHYWNETNRESDS